MITVLESPVVSAVLWVAAGAAAVWILVPAIAFALGKGWVRTKVLPDVGPPPTHGDDSAFAPRLRELTALGFRAAGRTRQSGRFISPLHWRWQSFQPAQWAQSRDGRSHASLYRLIPDEPARISFITLFSDGGLVRTACPGPLPTEGVPDNYRMLALRGVDAEALLALHQQRIEAYEGERGARARAATIDEITAVDDALSWTVIRKVSASSYSLFLVSLPVLAVCLVLMRRGGPPAFALAICAVAAFHALLLWAIRGPLRRHNARRSHTEDITVNPDRQRPPTDIAEDGTILATGVNERRLRKMAVVASGLAAVWPIYLASKLPIFATRGGGPAIAFGLAVIAAGAVLVYQLLMRARGRMLFSNRGRRDPSIVWACFFMLNMLFRSGFQDRKGVAFSGALLVVSGLSIILGVAGMLLEKKRGK